LPGFFMSDDTLVGARAIYHCSPTVKQGSPYADADSHFRAGSLRHGSLRFSAMTQPVNHITRRLSACL
jgi:hypothetical protein